MSLPLALVLLGTNVPAAMVPDTDCERISYLFFNRHLNSTWLDSAQALLEQERVKAPHNELCLYLSARSYLQLGERAQTRAEKLGFYTRARAIADTLRRLYDLNPDGHMWWATAEGRIGQLEGMVRAAFKTRSIRREFLRTVELDSGYALAWYALGRLYQELPGVMGGNRSMAEQFFRRGIRADSHYTAARLGLAKLLVAEGRRGEAREQLVLLLAETEPTGPAECVLSDRPAAEELLLSLSAERQ